MLGPLSPRVDFLTSTMRIAEHLARLAEPPPGALRLLSRMAQNIPGAVEGFAPADPGPRSARPGPSWRCTGRDTQRSGPRLAGRGWPGNYRTRQRLFGVAAMNT